MAKKKVTAKVVKNFVVLDGEMQSCCGERFVTLELAQKEAEKHVQADHDSGHTDYNSGTDCYEQPVYTIAQLISTVAAPKLPEKIVPVITIL